MRQKKVISCGLVIGTIMLLFVVSLGAGSLGHADTLQENVYAVGKLKAIDSASKLKVGDKAPDFTLPAVSDKKISLAHYRGKKNVVISFVPAAWTPVCSEQWPGYNIAKDIFDEYNAQLIGITVDNIPTLFAWTHQMGKLWFPVLSDFWPHGAVAIKYGILRTDGVSERALFVIDKKGIPRSLDLPDIKKRPSLDDLVKELKKLKQ